MKFFNETKIRAMARRHRSILMDAFDGARSGGRVTQSDRELIKPGECNVLGAMNGYSRIAWGKAVCQELACKFSLSDKNKHTGKVYLVTLADISCATKVDIADISLDFIRRKLPLGLRGVSYLGMIEPAYYVNLQAGVRFTGTRCLYWHLHALVWGVTAKDIKTLVERLNGSANYLAIAPGLKGVHRKLIKQGDLPKVVGYILKPPVNGYRISRRDIERDGELLVDQNGEIQAKFKQGKSKLRPGERVALFHVMKDMRLDKLAVAGGQGVPLLARAKRRLVSQA